LLGVVDLKIKAKNRLSILLWSGILLFLVAVLTFPQWITIFYPQPHQEIVMNYASESKIDSCLVFAIMRAESKYQTGAQSSAGAKGLMQIMPETAAWIASKHGITDFKIEQLHDPEVNIQFACWYLADLEQEFNGETPVVIAAYNAGRGTVSKWLEQDVWDGSSKNLDQIPFTETREYVTNVLKNYEAYQAIYE